MKQELSGKPQITSEEQNIRTVAGTLKSARWAMRMSQAFRSSPRWPKS
jgi:hypothetical protein